MKTIWKFPLGPVTDRRVVPMPYGAQVLHVQVQDDQPCLWALVEADNTLRSRTFRTFGTGYKIPYDAALAYVGTYQLAGGQLVYHVFEEV